MRMEVQNKVPFTCIKSLTGEVYQVSLYSPQQPHLLNNTHCRPQHISIPPPSPNLSKNCHVEMKGKNIRILCAYFVLQSSILFLLCSWEVQENTILSSMGPTWPRIPQVSAEICSGRQWSTVLPPQLIKLPFTSGISAPICTHSIRIKFTGTHHDSPMEVAIPLAEFFLPTIMSTVMYQHHLV